MSYHGKLQFIPLHGFGSIGFQRFTYPSLQPMLLGSGNQHVKAVGATLDDEPIGLALALILPRPQVNRLASLFVQKQHRGRGIGTQLLTALEQELIKSGHNHLRITYETGRECSVAAERVLAKLDWPNPEPERLLCRCDRRMCGSDWVAKDYRLSGGYEIVPWRELRDEQLAELQRDDERDSWIPASLRPWEYQGIEFNSVALLRQNRIIGWVLTQRFDTRTLIYSNSWMYPRQQRKALILPCYARAVRKHCEHAELDRAIWVVPFEHPSMVHFVRRRLSPFMNKVEELRASTKNLCGDR